MPASEFLGGAAAPPTGQAVPADQFLGGAATPPPADKGTVLPAVKRVAGQAVGAVAQAGKDYWGEYTKQSNEAVAGLRQAGKDIEAVPTGDVLGGYKAMGKGLLAIGNVLWSPVSAAVTEATAPIQKGITAIGGQVAKALPSGPAGQPGLGVTKEDVGNVTSDINDALEQIAQLSTGLIGGDPETTALHEKPTVEVAARTEAKAQGAAAAFDELAIKNPKAADTLATTVEATQPQLGKQLKLQVKMKAKADLPAQEAVGETLARSSMEDEPENYWAGLHARMAGDYADHTEAALPVSSHDLLTTMIKRLPQAAEGTPDWYVKQTLLKLRAKAPDLPVEYKLSLQDTAGSDSKAAGYFSFRRQAKPGGGVGIAPVGIEVRLGEHSTKTTIHEIVHSATSKFIDENPDHPAVQEIARLHKIAQQRWQEKLNAVGPHVGMFQYGLKDVHEFVAEALSNQHFQDWLVKSEGWAKPGEKLGNLWNRFVGAVQRIFGIKDYREAQLLHNVMQASHDVMDLQAAQSVDKASEGIQRAVADQYRLADEDPKSTKPKDERSFEDLTNFNARAKGLGVASGKIKEYWNFILRNIAPESLGPEAKQAGAVVAKAIAERTRSESVHWHQGMERRKFWNANLALVRPFIAGFEKGKAFADPILNKAAEGYRAWSRAIVDQDKAAEIEYDPIDHYMPHIFQDAKGVEAWMNQRFGSKWTEPGFTKDRDFQLYEQAIKAGFKPKYTNPEDIMLARQYASDAARMKADSLRELERQGLAMKIEKGDKVPEYLATRFASPSGGGYWVHNTAAQVLHNAFNSKSMWTLQGPGGDAFRGLMWLKNKIVPIRLAASLFHPLHIITIHNATGMVRASKELLAGTMSPLKWAGTIGKEMTLVSSQIADSVQGSRLLKAFQGKIKDTELTDADKQSIQYMMEGGFVPEMAAQFRGRSMEAFRTAVQQRKVSAVFRAPWAAMEATQGVMFQKWIPALKVASYLKDVQAAIKVNPELTNDATQRMVALCKLAKSVDNRYGEMAYNTLFWNRWVKDLAVANTLSLGWQLGFIREFGGGALDIGQGLVKPGGLANKARAGDLDRPMFSMYYLTQALGYGGLMTWAMTGKPPTSLTDYIYPQTGEQGADGKPLRVSTMFYTREIASLVKHSEQEGVISGLTDIVRSKAAGTIGLIQEWATGLNDFGQEIRDPNAPAYKQLEQTLAHTLVDLQPISVTGAAGKDAKGKVLSGLGFNPAPKYATQSPGEAAISQTYDKYYAPKETPYDSAARSQDAKTLHQAYATGDDAGFDGKLEAMQEKYKLTGTEIKQMVRDMARGKTGEASMFQHFTWEQQKAILDKMTPAERERFAPFVNRQHRGEVE